MLLDAVALLDEDVRKRMRLALFGFPLNGQASEAQKRIATTLAALKDCVVHYGPYHNDEVQTLMRSVDWVVVPSVWWENSPLVIQEARACGVPILCADIGGMREKVRPGIDGAHFLATNPIDLADKMSDITEGRLTLNPEPAGEHSELVGRILAVYRGAILGSERIALSI